MLPRTRPRPCQVLPCDPVQRERQGLQFAIRDLTSCKTSTQTLLLTLLMSSGERKSMVERSTLHITAECAAVWFLAAVPQTGARAGRTGRTHSDDLVLHRVNITRSTDVYGPPKCYHDFAKPGRCGLNSACLSR